ncbi:hypothetical protein HYT18_01345 [Candidatus Microgenomates bacterium]|nr:hypothetical protein [Candidatus Microgenomates bacterium]
MKTTQQHLAFADIKDDLIFLKDGGGALVLQTSAVNFGLLSAREQVAIIAAFAQLLNSLSFSIQIVVHSERLNISSYLNLLDQAKKSQTNPLLSKLMTSYRQFIQTTIKENEVLDKKFYIVIPLFKLEVGLTSSKEALDQKIKTVLFPRRDQLIRQLNRVGLKATQLTSTKLIDLFYDIYNGGEAELSPPQPLSEAEQVKLNQVQPVMAPTIQSQSPLQTIPPQGPTPYQPLSSQPTKTHPFVVEELEET